MNNFDKFLDRTPTPIIRPIRLNRFYGVNNIYLKLEGLNPTGNHKYWFAQIACKTFLKMQKYNGIGLASCGHFAQSLAWFSANLGIHVALFTIKNSPIEVVRSKDTLIFNTANNYEEAVNTCANFCLLNGYMNITPGFGLSSVFVNGLGISQEISDFFGDIPTTIVCPVGNGTTLAGIHNGLKSIQRVKSRHTMVGVGVNKNKLFNPRKPLEQKIDWDLEPIASDKPLDEEYLRIAIEESEGLLLRVDKSSIKKAKLLLTKLESINCHFSSASPIAALKQLLKIHNKNPYINILLILTTLIS